MVFKKRKAKIRIGSRGSKLALKQSSWVLNQLAKRYPDISFQQVVISTSGDKDRRISFFNESLVGVFTKEIETKLLQNEIDIAVHSLKDLTTTPPRGLEIAAYPRRNDPRDVLLTQKGSRLKDLKKGARIGTASLRRQRQLLRLRSDLKVRPIRGNVQTRVRQVLAGQYDGIVLAKAGLNRLGSFLEQVVSFAPRQMIPACGQGILAVQVRKKDKVFIRMVRCLNDPKTEQEALAERECLKALQGGCRVPVAVFGKSDGQELHIRAGVYSVKNHDAILDEISGSVRQARRLGQTLAKRLLKKGAKAFLHEARHG